MPDQSPKPVIKFEKAFLHRVFDLAIAAFGLVAALAWNDLITSLVRAYIPEGSDVLARLIYAIVVTLLAVGVTMWIGSATARVDRENKTENGQKRT